MTSWQTILDNFPPKDQLELTEEEQAYIPIYLPTPLLQTIKRLGVSSLISKNQPFGVKE